MANPEAPQQLKFNVDDVGRLWFEWVDPPRENMEDGGDDGLAAVGAKPLRPPGGKAAVAEVGLATPGVE